MPHWKKHKLNFLSDCLGYFHLLTFIITSNTQLNINQICFPGDAGTLSTGITDFSQYTSMIYNIFRCYVLSQLCIITVFNQTYQELLVIRDIYTFKGSINVKVLPKSYIFLAGNLSFYRTSTGSHKEYLGSFESHNSYPWPWTLHFSRLIHNHVITIEW